MQKYLEISAFCNEKIIFKLDVNCTAKTTVNSIKLDGNNVISTLGIDGIKFILYHCVVDAENNDKYHCCGYIIDVIEIDCHCS